MADLETRLATSIELQAVVIRADGTREDLGTIAYWHKNPLRRLWARLTRKGNVSLG